MNALFFRQSDKRIDNLKYGCATAQLVKAWTCQQRGIASVLCGARKSEKFVENVAAGGTIMVKDDLLRMRKAAQGLEPVVA